MISWGFYDRFLIHECYFSSQKHTIFFSFNAGNVLVQEKRLLIIFSFHQNGLTTQDIVAEGIARERTVYMIIKAFQDTGSMTGKKASGRQNRSSDH